MFKIRGAIRKEVIQLWSDKVGLGVLFLMPLMFVYVVTIVQESVFQSAEEDKTSILVSYKSGDEVSQEFVEELSKNGLMRIVVDTSLRQSKMKEAMLAGGHLTALYLPEDFSDRLSKGAGNISRELLVDVGLTDSIAKEHVEAAEVSFFYDPVLQEHHLQPILMAIRTRLNIMQSSMIMESVFDEAGLDEPGKWIDSLLNKQQVTINQSPASEIFSSNPNTTQHNVPAWTIFAMFFMVTSLGSKLVRERKVGSFLRLRASPTNLRLVIFSKILTYVAVGVFQMAFIFLITYFSFPLIGLPELQMPENFLGTILLTIMASFAAVSFSMVIGFLTSTETQASGIGAILVMIFAALGGIWVPTFLMSDALQTVSMASPLNWCLEGFYVLFLKGGSWSELANSLLFILAFILICQAIVFIKMKVEKLI